MKKPTVDANGSLKGRKILVTGGTTGIGRAIALRLSAEGAKVLIFGRHQKELDDAMRDIRKKGPTALGTVADVTRAEDMKRVFEMVDNDLEGIDVLINNAGLSADDLKTTPDDEREDVLLTNISGYLRCSRMAMERMEENAHIILVGSVSADEREPGGSIYVATKAAIQGFADSFRQEAQKDGIKVSLIEPGETGSDMIEKDVEEQRKSQEKLEMLKAEDVAACVQYILTQPPRCTVAKVTLMPARSSDE